MPIINFTNPLYVVVALVLVLLCAFLANQYKKNTIPCIVLLVFLAILVGHTIELATLVDTANIPSFAVSIAVDEIFIFASFLMFLWLDRIQIDVNAKAKASKKSGNNSKKKKKDVKEAKEEKVIEKDGLDVLWKKV